MKKEGHILRVLAFLVGMGIFLYTIHSIGGIQLVVKNLVQMQWALLFVLANSFLWMLSYTEAWKLMFGGLKQKIGFFSLLRIKLCGEGVNFMTPVGFMAGDPVRLLMLRKFFGPEARLRSVVIDRTMHSLAAQYFNIFGLLLLFTQNIDFPLWFHLALLFIYLSICGILTTLIVRMITGKGFSIFEKVIAFLKIEKRFPRVTDVLNDLRNNLIYYKDRPKRVFFAAFLYHFFGRFLGAVEIFIAFYFFTGRCDIIFSVIMASLTSFFAVTCGFIPGALGVLESLYAQMFTLYGFAPDMGVTIQIIRRLRVLFWVALGILLLDYNIVGEYTKKFRKNKGMQNITNELTK